MFWRQEQQTVFLIIKRRRCRKGLHLPPVKIAEPCYAVQIVMEQKRSQRRKLSCILLFVLYSNKTAGKPLITNKALLPFRMHTDKGAWMILPSRRQYKTGIVQYI